MARNGDTIRVLLAQGPGIDREIRDSLSGCEVTSVQSFAEAQRALEEKRFGLVLIDLQFEQSRMLELLEYLKSLERYQDVPVVRARRPGVLRSARSRRDDGADLRLPAPDPTPLMLL